MGVFLFGSEQGEKLRRVDKSHSQSDPIRVIPAKFPKLCSSHHRALCSVRLKVLYPYKTNTYEGFRVLSRAPCTVILF